MLQITVVRSQSVPHSLCALGCSFTGVNIHLASTCFTLDIATPVKLAMAALRHRGLVGVVASPTTHKIASVHSFRIFVAFSSFCAK